MKRFDLLGSWHRWALVFLVGSLIFAGLVIQALWGDWNGTRVHRLEGSRGSAEELARSFLEALYAGNEARAGQMAVSRAEFEELIWPELPASSPRTNLSCEFVWEQMHMRSRAALAGTIFDNRGNRYQLVHLRFSKGTEVYNTFRVHRDTRIVVVDEDGKRRELNLFGSILEMDGEFKILSFTR